MSKGIRWDASDSESESDEGDIIISIGVDCDDIIVTNQTVSDVRVLMNFDGRLIRFKVYKMSSRPCRHKCPVDKILVGMKKLSAGIIRLKLDSKYVLKEPDQLEQPMAASASVNSTDRTSADTSGDESPGSIKMQLAKLIMMADALRYEIKFYLRGPDGKIVATNLFE